MQQISCIVLGSAVASEGEVVDGGKEEAGPATAEGESGGAEVDAATEGAGDAEKGEGGEEEGVVKEQTEQETQEEGAPEGVAMESGNEEVTISTTKSS